MLLVAINNLLSAIKIIESNSFRFLYSKEVNTIKARTKELIEVLEEEHLLASVELAKLRKNLQDLEIDLSSWPDLETFVSGKEGDHGQG